MSWRRLCEQRKHEASFSRFFDVEAFLGRLFRRVVQWDQQISVRRQLVTVLRVVLIGRTCDVHTVCKETRPYPKEKETIWIYLRRKGEHRWHWEAISENRDSPTVCPVRLFSTYRSLTIGKRGMDTRLSLKDDPEQLSPGEGFHLLLVSSNKPYNVLSRECVRCDVARVMKDVEWKPSSHHAP